MKRLASVLSLALVLGGCTNEGPAQRAQPTVRPAAGDLMDVKVAAANFEVPKRWAYAVSRQQNDSWNFELSARHAFNTRAELCDRMTGPLGALLRFERVFIIGSAYRAERFPKGAELQVPGEFRLEPDALGASEGTGCRPTYKINFRLDEYLFAVHVAVHRNTTENVRQEALAVLNSVVGTARP